MVTYSAHANEKYKSLKPDIKWELYKHYVRLSILSNIENLKKQK
jgi:hypothetical protein